MATQYYNCIVFFHPALGKPVTKYRKVHKLDKFKKFADEKLNGYWYYNIYERDTKRYLRRVYSDTLENIKALYDKKP